MSIRIGPEVFQHVLSDEQRAWIKDRITGAGYDWRDVTFIDIALVDMTINLHRGGTAIIVTSEGAPYPEDAS